MSAALSVSKLFLVVPCFNEEFRLRSDVFINAIEAYPNLHWIFVNDGSRDQTQRVLNLIKDNCPTDRVFLLELEHNKGKAEAVRFGLNHALTHMSSNLDQCGYFDADLATPVEEVMRLSQVLVETKKLCVLGIRIFLQGRDIRRSRFRYLLGKGFALVASLLINQRFQDTQCGAKVFLNDPKLREVFSQPFASKWLFDIELILRLKQIANYSNNSFLEEPLRTWQEVGGSKLKWHALFVAVFDLLKIFKIRYF